MTQVVELKDFLVKTTITTAKFPANLTLIGTKLWNFLCDFNFDEFSL